MKPGKYWDYPMLKVFSKIREKFQYGLFLYFLTSHLKKVGIEILPYYWVQEGLFGDSPIAGRNLPADYTFKFLSLEDMKIIGNIVGREDENEPMLLKRLEKGDKCLAAKYQEQIAAFTWIDLTGDSFKEHRLSLNANEAYLYDMYTLKSFRGSNIAPYLRYECYKALKDMGRGKCYSASHVFNAPSIKFKQKLNAKIIATYLDVRLINKIHWNWKLKSYAKS